MNEKTFQAAFQVIENLLVSHMAGISAAYKRAGSDGLAVSMRLSFEPGKQPSKIGITVNLGYTAERIKDEAFVVVDDNQEKLPLGQLKNGAFAKGGEGR